MKFTRNGKEYEVGGGHDWFWPSFADGSWEPSTFRAFDEFLDKDGYFVDIGAWIGPTALYAAPRAKKVFAFEPDAVAYRSLAENLALNGARNVVPYPVAVSDKWEGISFGSKTRYGDSMSSVLWAKGEEDGGQKVPAVSLDSVIRKLHPSFVKIDIEGGEKDIFRRAEATLEAIRPTIHLSLHTPWFKGNPEDYQRAIAEGLAMYPHFYGENLEPIRLLDAFDALRFNSVVASFRKL